MSVFGGDSWAREAQYGKRRVDDLIIEGIDSSAYRKLPNGKFSCFVCPQRPILDTPLMLTTHMRGSRHQAAVSKRKERELAIEDERNKRIALSDCSGAAPCGQRSASANKPLIQRAQKAASDILNGRSPQPQGSTTQKTQDIRSYGWSPQGSTIKKSQDIRSYTSAKTTECISTQDKDTSTEVGAVSREIVSQQFDLRERQERELKFTAAGWKRDCHGMWYKDENVEFDSDEEDPNVCL